MSINPYRQDREELRELLQLFENLKAGKPNSFIEEEAFERIIEFYDDKDQLNNALEAADYGISQYPYSSSLLLKKADLLISLRRYKQALFILEEAELLDAGDTLLYILKTDAYLALDQQDKAAKILEDAIQNFDGDEKIDLLFELADVYDDYEEFEKVFECLKWILEMDPNNEEALYKICFWTDYTGRNEESIKLHQAIIEAYPFNELAWFNLGAAFQGIRLYEKAVDAYQYAVAIDEKFDYALRNMGDAYLRLRKYKDAVEVLEKVLELTRPEDVIFEAIGHCYDKMGNYAQARQFYRKASHIRQDDSHLYYKIAITYMNENVWDSAIKNLEIALRIHRMQPDYNLALGQCYMEQGKLEDAIGYFGNVVRSKPKNVNGWTELLNCLCKGGFYDEALEYAGYAFEQTEGKAIFLFYRSNILYSLGKSKEATLQLQQAMEKNPKLIKKFIAINPGILQNQQVVDVIARYKKRKSI
jgi:tetratricopeptide (TPR) repeat protein